MSESSEATGSRFDVRPENREIFGRLVAERLFDDSAECKMWIIRLMVDIENDEEVSVHRFLSEQMIEEVKRCTHALQPQLQRTAVSFLTTILDVEANNPQYLLQHGILQKCIELLSLPDKLVFADLIMGLQSFLEWPDCADRLVGLHLVEKLDRVLNTSASESLHSEIFIFLSKFFRALHAPISVDQAQVYLDVFFGFAAIYFSSLAAEFYKCVLELFKYLFRTELHNVFAEKANIVHISEFYKGYPILLRTVIGKLAHKPSIMKSIVKAETRYFFALIVEELPTASVTLTLALFQLLNAILKSQPQSILTVWHRDEIMEELQSNLSIDKDLTITIFDIYTKLIVHTNYYCQVSPFINPYSVPQNIIKAIAEERDPQVIEKGLKAIDKILEFQGRHHKGQANKRAFTQGLRNNSDAGAILERLSQKPHKKPIMNLTQKILGPNFVKIQQQILPIDAVCKKMMENEP